MSSFNHASINDVYLEDSFFKKWLLSNTTLMKSALEMLGLDSIAS